VVPVDEIYARHLHGRFGEQHRARAGGGQHRTLPVSLFEPFGFRTIALCESLPRWQVDLGHADDVDRRAILLGGIWSDVYTVTYSNGSPYRATSRGADEFRAWPSLRDAPQSRPADRNRSYRP